MNHHATKQSNDETQEEMTEGGASTPAAGAAADPASIAGGTSIEDAASSSSCSIMHLIDNALTDQERGELIRMLAVEGNGAESSPENDTDSAHDGGSGSTATSERELSRGPLDTEVTMMDIISTQVSYHTIHETSAERWRRIRIVALYLITITILFADMNLLAPNLSVIAEEFGMTDEQRDVNLGGLIALGFFFVGAPVSFLVGWLADSMNRSPLFAGTVFFGELGCLMVYFVKNYWQLYVCRVMTGISVGGAIPVIYSVLGDLYPAKQRAAIAAVVTTGTGLGMGLGQAMAGSVDSWRTPFLAVSIPGLICSGLVLLIQDPKRGAKEEAVLELRRHRQAVPSTLSESERRTTAAISCGNKREKSTLENCGMDLKVSALAASLPRKRSRVEPIDLSEDPAAGDSAHNDENETTDSRSTCVSCKSTCELLKIPSVALTIAQALPGALPFGFCATFLNDFLQQERGMTKQEATGVLLTFGVGNAVGVIVGGFLGHFSYKRDVRGPPLIMGIALLLGCIPFYFLINSVDSDAGLGVVAGVTVLSGILVVIPVPLERSILTNVCLPKLRGRANALVSIVDDLGKGLGPALVSLLITSFDRQTAFNISLIGWIIGGVLSLTIMIFVRRDEEAVQEQIREKLALVDEEGVSCIDGIDI